MYTDYGNVSACGKVMLCALAWTQRSRERKGVNVESYHTFLSPLIGVTNTVCEHQLLRSIQDLQTVQIIKTLRYEKKVAAMFLLMISCFLVCWTPYAIVSMLEAFGRKNVVSPTVAIIPSFFAKSSTAYNPLIYVFMSRKFRRCLLQLICSRRAWLQRSLKERPLAPVQRPIRPIVMSGSCSSRHRPKKRVTFSSSSIVFIITSNDFHHLDVTSKASESKEVNVIQVRPL